MQKWEYLVITGIVGTIPVMNHAAWGSVYPRCFKMSEQGLELVTDFQHHKRQGVTEVDAIACSVAELGNQGWEMVGVAAGMPKRDIGNPVSHQMLYFKRPKA